MHLLPISKTGPVIFPNDKSFFTKQLVLDAEKHITKNKDFEENLQSGYTFVGIVVFMTASMSFTDMIPGVNIIDGNAKEARNMRA